MGLLITPSGIRLPFSVSYYTEAYCKAKKIAHRKQTELAAQLIRQLPLPPKARVMVLGDTAFDAEAVRTACEERKFSWIVPINPERVLAGAKPRPKVSSLSEILTADQMVCLQVHPGKGKYVDYRRISRYRIGPKFKPRTYYVHEESRDVHSVGMVRLFFSTTKAPAQGHRVEVQKILLTNDEKLTLRDVIELYQLRWQIELFFKRAQIHTGIASLPLQEVREGGNLGHALPGDVRLFGVDSSAQIETESAEKEREGVVASSANLRIGPGRASGSRTARTEATGGEDGDTRRAKSACQATPAVTSQGIPRGDLIGGSQKAQLQNAHGRLRAHGTSVGGLPRRLEGNTPLRPRGPDRCRRGSGPIPRDPSPNNPQPDYRMEVPRSGSTAEDWRGYEDNRRRVRHQALRP